MRKINRAFSEIGIEEGDPPSEAPRISVFPQDKTNWRIDWFGDIAFPDRSVRRKQPSVFIHLSRVIDDRFTSDPSVLLSPQCTSPAKLQKRVWVSVGTLVLIRIGDIWRDGLLVYRPDYELEKLPGVQISKNTTAIVKAGLNLNDEGFLLPINEHPWHLQCTQSYCLMVQLSRGRRMIIPCVELVRFYFGSSSNLLSQLFLPPLVRESLFSSASLDPQSRRLRIDLADKMSGASAADIGRISMDPVAARAARIVGNSCLRASTAGHTIYPQAAFPFEGKTDLIASGRWLSHGEIQNSTFLVYSLRSCSHPFPFRSLQYTTKGTSLRKKPHGSTTPQGSAAKPQRCSAPETKNHALVEKDPSNNLARKNRNYREAVRFPDLEKKYIWRNIQLTATETSGEAVGSGASPIDSSAVGDSGSDRRVRPVDLSILARKVDNSVPFFLRNTVEDLQHLSGVSVELLTESQHDGWTVPISVLSNEDGEIAHELMVECPEDGLRMRRAAVFAFKRDLEHVCAVIIESEPPHMKIYTTTGQDQDEVWATLRCATIDFTKGARSDLLDSSLSELIGWVFESGSLD